MAQAFPRTRRTRKASGSSALGVSLFVLAMSVAGFWALTSTLQQMTWQDCQAGVQRACDELQK